MNNIDEILMTHELWYDFFSSFSPMILQFNNLSIYIPNL